MTDIEHFGKPADEAALNTAVAALQENGFDVEIVENLEEASKSVFTIIPKGADVFTATSVTLDEAGISQRLNESGDYVSVRDEFMQYYGQPDKAIEMRRIGSAMDYAIGSVHAVTEDGHVLIASNSGSQLPSYVYGANHVVWVVGSQKIVKDLNQALERIEEHTLPLEDARAQKAYGNHSVLSKILLYRKDPQKRIHIILVKQAVGY
jgi:L-lactate utilization protein LutB